VLVFVACSDARLIPKQEPSTPCQESNCPSPSPNDPGTPDNPNPASPTTPANPTSPSDPADCSDPGLAQQVAPGSFTASSSFKACYRPGASETVSFNLKYNGQLATESVKFVVDIVDRNNNNRSVLSSFFGSASDISITPNIFNNNVSAAELEAGIQAQINFRFKNTAPVGDAYSLVVSAFRADGSTRNPADLIGRIGYRFRVEK
jgi:hypothetical protein